jgi:hypothetical protein
LQNDNADERQSDQYGDDGKEFLHRQLKIINARSPDELLRVINSGLGVMAVI